MSKRELDYRKFGLSCISFVTILALFMVTIWSFGKILVSGDILSKYQIGGLLFLYVISASAIFILANWKLQELLTEKYCDSEDVLDGDDDVVQETQESN